MMLVMLLVVQGEQQCGGTAGQGRAVLAGSTDVLHCLTARQCDRSCVGAAACTSTLTHEAIHAGGPCPGSLLHSCAQVVVGLAAAHIFWSCM